MNEYDQVHIGTSGWHYRHWMGLFYPEKMASAALLTYYSAQFLTVEINNSFYRLPSAETFSTWTDITPPTFLFAVKANRFITHMKKLKDPKEPLEHLLERANRLGRKLGPILFQLPPHWSVNLERLKAFLQALPKNRQFAFEFRDQSWFTPSVYHLLEDYKAALCVYNAGETGSPLESTAEFVYLRFHGAAGFGGRYGKDRLVEWSARIVEWANQHKEVFAYFNNDPFGHAIEDARDLIQLVEQQGIQVPHGE